MRINIGDLILANRSEELTFYIVRNIRSKSLRQYRCLDLKKYDASNIYVTEIINESEIVKYFKFDMFDWKETVNDIFKDLSDKDKICRISGLETMLSKKIESFSDYIHYDKLSTIDDCLDAMNDLQELHSMFKDDIYLEEREKIIKRLESLTKNTIASQIIKDIGLDEDNLWMGGYEL